MSHRYGYLMQAMLALAGSHLSLYVDDVKNNKALLHRQEAIKGLERSFTHWPPKAEEAHVMLATSYILAFQSGYLADGFLDHILNIRGCALISNMILKMDLRGTFSMDQQIHDMVLKVRLDKVPSLDQPLTQDALRSLASFSHLLRDPDARDIERALFAQLVVALRALLIRTPCHTPSDSPSDNPPIQVDPNDFWSKSTEGFSQSVLPLLPNSLAASFEDVDALSASAVDITAVPDDHEPRPLLSFKALTSGLLILATWPQDEVLPLFSTDNKLGCVIMAHFCAVRFVVAPLSAPDTVMRTPIKGMVEWCEKILDSVKDDEDIKWTRYVQWPARVLRAIRCGIELKRSLSFGDLYEILTLDPGAILEGRLSTMSVTS
ncbi:hypothetical protein K491DRAFT_721218 [Lophiostoma macrostomum CBS 122681]|uniref:Transcription factor domain-containing protein n=1 Tax=Lophiostoma macrostomum CBS 122681 TaxID=1314788 RepID=A0A6A6SQ12_9PLEO|nr:hypothetical protein K491DRAFT_721218 [Lophiostoma macrostomum CBS 122681]